MTSRRKPFIKTTANERTWVDQAGGWLVPEVRCPECLGKVVYNGNYFCEDFNAGQCTWALGHPARTKADRAISDRLGIGYD